MLLAGCIGLLASFMLSQASFDLPFLRPTSSEQTLVFATLSAIIFLLLLVLSFVLVRTLVKLFAERRVGVLGSKFRTKMVVGALALSFAPVIFLFLFAYGLMNRSIDKWFSRPVEEVREDTEAMTRLLSKYASQNVRAEAQSIAAAPETVKAFEGGNFAGVVNVFREHEITLQKGFVFAISEGRAEASLHAPDGWPALESRMPLSEAAAGEPAHFSFGDKEYILGSARVGARGTILVAMPLPSAFSDTVKQIEASQQRYFELIQKRRLVRRTYVGELLLLTVVVLFASTWFALFLSKLVTRPVAALAEATQQISRGRLDHRVQVAASDELGELVESFNRMAGDLEASRQQIVASSRDLKDANIALEQRRRHMETILESIPTGVLSLDAEKRVTHVNVALQRIFGATRRQQGAHFQVGALLNEVFSPEVMEDMEPLLRRADRMGMTSSQLELSWQRATLNLAVTVAALQHEDRQLGYVVVFEDLSDLLKAQKQAAWREVARRVAHEIKNPLTPIALSAERILRHLERGAKPDPVSLSIIHSCADTIAGAVETVRSLVDEFSALARFPTAQPTPANINAIVESVLSMFNGRLDKVKVRTALAPGLPKVMADGEALKRALANLVDNAAEATEDSLLREVQISTALLPSKDAVEVVVADTGPGVTPELKEKLFLPYFSTKKRGTGLGLAIVSRIIEDHHGSIRVEENDPVGARFIVELPLATEGVSSSRASGSGAPVSGAHA
ncbi:MAG TPA: ATP-binding protein [Terriglobales bacterium]|nr:ATP-binding protein [Terriglobales bacterium]